MESRPGLYGEVDEWVRAGESSLLRRRSQPHTWPAGEEQKGEGEKEHKTTKPKLTQNHHRDKMVEWFVEFHGAMYRQGIRHLGPVLLLVLTGWLKKTDFLNVGSNIHWWLSLNDFNLKWVIACWLFVFSFMGYFPKKKKSAPDSTFTKSMQGQFPKSCAQGQYVI